MKLLDLPTTATNNSREATAGSEHNVTALRLGIVEQDQSVVVAIGK